jgi:hypothetical protein
MWGVRVLATVLELLVTLGPAASWLAVVVAGVVGVFVVYVGLAVVVALFHRDEKARKHAVSVLRMLLKAVLRGRF